LGRYDLSWRYRLKITIDHRLVAEDLTDFPVLITHAVVQAGLLTHARSDGADVVTGGDETTRLKRELVTYDVRRQPQARQGQEHRTDRRPRRPHHGHRPRHGLQGAGRDHADGGVRLRGGRGVPIGQNDADSKSWLY
jgi:hypothetical protein